MTAISVSERLLEMAAFYTWLDFTLTNYVLHNHVSNVIPSLVSHKKILLLQNNNSQMYCQAENRLLNIARLNSVGQQGLCLGFRHNKTRRIAADFSGADAEAARNYRSTVPSQVLTARAWDFSSYQCFVTVFARV